MSILIFQVNVQPEPKKRPRVINGRAHTPEKTRRYEQHIGWAARLAMRELELVPEQFEGPLLVSLSFWREGRRPVDLDNLVKAVLDGMNGVVYTDDKQVQAINAMMQLGVKQPGVKVRVKTVTEDDLQNMMDFKDTVKGVLLWQQVLEDQVLR